MEIIKMHGKFEIRKLLSIGICAFMLSGCSIGPDYEKPFLQTLTDWSLSENTQTQISDQKPIVAEWWTVFNDPTLTELIEQTAQNNLDVKIAEANILEARANRRSARSGFFPTIESDASAQREGVSEGIPQAPGVPLNRDFYNTGFDASYELDIFGGIRRSVEASDARLSSAIENRRDILLTALSETAVNYIELRGTQRRITVTKENIELQRKTVDTVQRRFDTGDTNNFELARAKAQLRITEASLPNLTADLREKIYSIGVLTGRDPQTLLADLLSQKPLPLNPDIVPVGLRSDILMRRPDIRAAERELAASTADIGVATSDLFPKFFLTGSAGVESLTFSSLFESASTAWALGPLIQWPIFRGGEIRAQIKIEEAQAQAAAYEYEKAVLTALEDVETALVRYGEELETRKILREAVDLSESAVEYSRGRYEGGIENIVSLIDAERELVDVEDELIQSETRSLTNLISVYKALGGGWENYPYTPTNSEDKE